MLLIRKGRVVDPASGTDAVQDVLIENGMIREIGTDLQFPEGNCTVLDAQGCVVAPGFVDVHVHFRDPGYPDKEDIHTGAAAAKAGGFTTVVMMANTMPRIDNTETLEYCLRKGAETGIHVLACANVTMGMKGKELTDMDALKAAGAVGFTDDGVPIMNEEICRAAMVKCAQLGVPISFHEENPAYISNNGVNHGKASEYYHIGGSDRQAEIDMVARDLRLVEGTGASIDIQHISSREAVELVRQGKARGLDVHAEATPHHFTLTEEAVIRYGTNAKMNPPLRESADREAIVEGLRDGTIDMIATDHAPHTRAEKERPITQAPSGITGLETSLALGITYLVRPGHLTMLQLMERMSTGPAKVYHLPGGSLGQGAPADLAIFDPEAQFVPERYHSRASNTPFTGWSLFGVVRYTICGGKVVYRAES